MSTREQILVWAATATETDIEAFKRFKEQGKETSKLSTRMLDYAQAGRALNVSRQTIRCMVKAGRLPIVEIRCGRFRIPEQAIIDLSNCTTRKAV